MYRCICNAVADGDVERYHLIGTGCGQCKLRRNKMLLKALIARLEGEIAVAKANIDVYLTNSVGIGEHPDVVEAVESQVEKMAAAQEKIDTIKANFLNQIG